MQTPHPGTVASVFTTPSQVTSKTKHLLNWENNNATCWLIFDHSHHNSENHSRSRKTMHTTWLKSTAKWHELKFKSTHFPCKTDSENDRSFVCSEITRRANYSISDTFWQVSPPSTFQDLETCRRRKHHRIELTLNNARCTRCPNSSTFSTYGNAAFNPSSGNIDRFPRSFTPYNQQSLSATTLLPTKLVLTDNGRLARQPDNVMPLDAYWWQQRRKNSAVLYGGISSNSKPRLYSNYCNKRKVLPEPNGPTGWRWSPFCSPQTPAYTARPWIPVRRQCIARRACLLPSFRRCQIILPGDRGTQV